MRRRAERLYYLYISVNIISEARIFKNNFTLALRRTTIPRNAFFRRETKYKRSRYYYAERREIFMCTYVQYKILREVVINLYGINYYIT